jgi:DNA-binding transcriptional ArsR family regulator
MARTLQFRDPKRHSFTIMPDAVLMSPRLSMGAKLVYQQLLHYARQSGACFPGQATLARHLPATDRAVRQWLRELEALGLVTVERRGLRKTNLYWIETLTETVIRRLEHAGEPRLDEQRQRRGPDPGETD